LQKNFQIPKNTLIFAPLDDSRESAGYAGRHQANIITQKPNREKLLGLLLRFLLCLLWRRGEAVTCISNGNKRQDTRASPNK
jgi:hypothetical protein